jgi:hypothetical protein
MPMPTTMELSSDADLHAIATNGLDRVKDNALEIPTGVAGTESHGPIVLDSALREPAPRRPNTGDRRVPQEDRRNRDDRRSSSLRRGRDRQRNAAANKIAYLGTILCALSVAVGTYAFAKAPITFTPSPACADGFGGQRIEHRGLSALWALVMVLAAAGLVIPDRKRRPILLIILCGVSVGLFAGAYFTVGSKFVGFCID